MTKDEFPPELERRIRALESRSETGDDFDAVSYWWLILFGVLIPVGLIGLGWFA